jgi:NAD-dependent deacetylase
MALSIQDKEAIQNIAQFLRKSQNILFITGAGISADSGLPTYRGIGGLYNDKCTGDGIPIEMALAGQTLKSHPEITWKYLSQIEEKCRHARFNRAHEIIAEMEKHFTRVWVLTQNIDGFHHAAGSRNVIEIHGNMHKLFCPACNWRTSVKDFSQITIPPHCPKCNHIARPDVVFFGELLPQKELQILSDEMRKGFDLYFSVGTSSVFAYIQQPFFFAKSLKRFTVEINPLNTEISDIVDIKLSLSAKEALDEIWKECYVSS